ncbi:hypothetical protein [Metabacillus sp. 84]|uniref:hypothetical protein n=1 Tax=Metabacillus sp. 84 TaxID=3404705 RepID=UPI003CF2B419
MLTAQAVEVLDKNVISERVVDHSDVQVVGEALVFTVVTNQDEPKDGENERTHRLSNPNGVPVNVTVNGTVKGQLTAGKLPAEMSCTLKRTMTVKC